MKSDSDLRRIFQGMVTTMGALEGIGPITNCTDVFVHLAAGLLNARTRQVWENSLGKSCEPPTYENLRSCGSR